MCAGIFKTMQPTPKKISFIYYMAYRVLFILAINFNMTFLVARYKSKREPRPLHDLREFQTKTLCDFFSGDLLKSSTFG